MYSQSIDGKMINERAMKEQHYLYMVLLSTHKHIKTETLVFMGTRIVHIHPNQYLDITILYEIYMSTLIYACRQFDTR